jgi:hypothetical protein
MLIIHTRTFTTTRPVGGSMADDKTLHDAFIDELRDVYDAEKQIS